MIKTVAGVVAGVLLGVQTAHAQFSNQKGKEVGKNDSKIAKCVNGTHTVVLDLTKQNNTGIYLPINAKFKIESESHESVKFQDTMGYKDPMVGYERGLLYLAVSNFKVDRDFEYGQSLIDIRGTKGQVYQRASAKHLMEEGRITITKRAEKDFKGGVLYAFLNIQPERAMFNKGTQTFKINVSGCPTGKAAIQPGY